MVESIYGHSFTYVREMEEDRQKGLFKLELHATEEKQMAAR
jgi:hypothetical protein